MSEPSQVSKPEVPQPNEIKNDQPTAPASTDASASAAVSEAVATESGSGGEATANATEAANANTSEANEEGLPEWEPLSPEIVEDEAIRGDYMLRCAVILLALLIGCRQIVESTTLLHVKTGKYLAAHGFWPPANDVFTSTATEHRWVNLSWLWDLVSSGAFVVGEGSGLSLLTAIVVALTWWMLAKTSRNNVSTWWGSVVGAGALLACHTHFSGQPETVTLLGMALLLWRLHSWRQSFLESDQPNVATEIARTVSLWSLVPLFALWSNLDSRMFLGLFALLLWGVGETLGSGIGRGSLVGSQRKQFWTVFAACVGASLLNPFGWQSLLAPIVLYGNEYPALRSYVGLTPTPDDLRAFPLWTSAVWTLWTLPLLSGLFVLVAALVSMILNARKVSLGDVLLFLGMTLLACIAINELAVVSIVACVIATLNGQQWYQLNCRQTYSIETRELLLTRGGRAVTVCAFFVLAVMAVNQSLFGVDGKRLGLGLSTPLRSMIDDYRTAVADALDDRPFNLTPKQGDLLIWLDQKPFIDSRLALFAGVGDDNLLSLHDRTRRSMAPPVVPTRVADTGANGNEAQAANPSPSDSVDAEQWKQTFDRFQLTHVMPRMVGVRPVTYFRLLTSPDWQLTHLGATCAVFYRQQNLSEVGKKYLADHRVNFVKPVFESDSPNASPRTDWPRRQTAFQRYVSPPEKKIPNLIQEAENLLLHVNAAATGQLNIEQPVAIAMALLAIRKANEGLGEVPDQAAAFHVLGEAYSFLSQIEANILREQGVNIPNELRFNQALAAYYQATLLEPNHANLRFGFMTLLQRFNRIDLALREAKEFERIVVSADGDDPATDELLNRVIGLKEQWLSRQEVLSEQIEKALESGAKPIELAQQVYQGGFVLEALKLLDSDLVAVREAPQAQAFRGLVLFESGQLETAYSQFEYESSNNFSAWRTPAAYCRLAHGEYDQATGLWKQLLEFGQQSVVSNLTLSLPLIQSPLHIAGYSNVWPVQHVASVSDALYRWRDEQSQLLWNTAMMQLESGKPHIATKTLKGLLEANPDTNLRPLLRFYLFVLTEELIDPEPPSQWIPIEGDMFAPDEE